MSPTNGSASFVQVPYNRSMGETVAVLLLSLPVLWAIKRIVTIYITLQKLGTRKAWALIPSEDFDANLKTIENIAEQLAAAYPWWAYWVYRRAAAVRIKLLSVRGRLLYVWEVQASAEGVIHNIAGVYRVEVVPLEVALERLRDTTTT